MNLFITIFPLNSLGITADIHLILLTIVITPFLIIYLLVRAYRRKCDSCKKWNAMKTYKTILTDSIPTTVMKTENTKNRNGDIIATREVHVPATRYYYDKHRACKHCDYEDILIISEVEEN